VTTSNFQLEFNSTGIDVPGTVTVAADLLSAVFTPSAPLLGSTTYRVRTFTGIRDLANNTLSGSSVLSRFTTAVELDTTAPSVTGVSPPDGQVDVPVNARVLVTLSEPLDIFSFNQSAVVLSVGGAPVAGVVSVNNTRNTLTFTPTDPLTVSTVYDVDVAGFTDRVGNAVVPFNSSFTTPASTTADTTRPTVSSITPSNGATDVPANTTIVWTFSEVIDPLSVTSGSLQVTISGLSGFVAGSYETVANVVTFTPLNSLPANALVRARAFSSIRDLVGNSLSGTPLSDFTISDAVVDTDSPFVELVTPADGTVDVGRNQDVVLTFNESLNANTLNTNNFALFVNGNRQGISVIRSSDNRVVTLSMSTLPASSLIEVIATNEVQDLSGNRLADFRSTFTTTSGSDTSRPSVAAQRPGSGATGVGLDTSVVLYVNQTLDTSTIPGALHVTQNGVEVNGTVSVTGLDRVIEFFPDVLWEHNALIQVFLDSTARDTAGNALNNYQGSFRTLADPATQRPFVVRSSPSSGGAIPTNAVIEIEYNEPLDSSTVNSSTVLLRQNISGAPVVDSTVSLVRERVIRIEPAADLNASSPYFFDILNGLRDLNGQTPNSSTDPNRIVVRTTFNTSATADTVAADTIQTSPPDGAGNIGLNALVRLRFGGEVINPLSVTGQTLLLSDGVSSDIIPCSISFTDGNREVLMVPHAPLLAAATYSLVVDGVADIAGNLAVVPVTQFTTGVDADTGRPFVTRFSPVNGASAVPVNTPMLIELNEPVDSITAQLSSNFRVTSLGVSIAGVRSLSADGRTLSFVPTVPWPMGQRIDVSVHSNIQDYAGNRMLNSSMSFTVAFSGDSTAPQVAAVSPVDGLTAVPTNANVVIDFDEPVQTTSIDAVSLTAGGTAVSIIRTLGNGNRRLTLRPANQLAALTEHTLTITGIADLAGNALVPVVTGFTTETGADLIRPVVNLIEPLNGATGVGTNTDVMIRFSERINPLTVTTSNFQLEFNNTGVDVPGTVTVAADLLSATFTPSAPLLGSTTYRVRTFTGIRDLANNTLSGSSVLSRFTTAVEVDTTAPSVTTVSPQDGQVDVPVNARVLVRLSEPLDVFSFDQSAVVVSAAGVPVAGTVSLNSTRNTLTFTPADVLSVNTTYSVAVAGFTDRVGNAVVPFSSSFTTSDSSTLDGTRPVVTSITPSNGATGVSTATMINFTFSESINPLTVSTGSIQLEVNSTGVDVPGSVALSPDGLTVTFTPDNLLSPSTEYRTRVFTSVQDLVGNVFSGTSIPSRFTTAP